MICRLQWIPQIESPTSPLPPYPPTAICCIQKSSFTSPSSSSSACSPHQRSTQPCHSLVPSNQLFLSQLHHTHFPHWIFSSAPIVDLNIRRLICLFIIQQPRQKPLPDLSQLLWILLTSLLILVFPILDICLFT
ncbi:hypothetical protein AX774_g1491 [Zancudomyces culisetae]|uniref:Uncharacterized protein n=1 Tax=Zancudomyces culisetae TaxID=1213189 RepID=A0A1R1PFG1_ZANCU|nr:hypothetical protein AX774_g6836 [Zancudomyces culisetae]OMH84982.1 hypothetical protein AX774_g1491 [Zancudomyces culisetae]|eukprot:OMH79740.1 hypothetical protein AX774_g6836 [Zancudomyces culisetae]